LGGAGAARFGVYVHVPFCTSRCDYCAFATWTDREHLREAYVRGCANEVEAACLPPASSVFFGGGTPSLLSAPELAVILGAIDRQPGAEVTVECNPESVDLAKLAGYRAAGVTRLSFGVQSLRTSVLATLGRRHDPAEVVRAARAAGDAGFAGAYSVDLIYGGAGESLADWRASLDGVLSLNPPPVHVSAYALTVEAGTPLAGQPALHPDPDDQADKYLLTDSILGDAGFLWYEVSNWAQPGAECRHNQLYWDQGDYRGIGCAAHSHARLSDGGARRWWNVRTPERYLRHVEAGQDPCAAEDLLDASASVREAAVLALRTAGGIDGRLLPNDPMIEHLLERRGGRVYLTLQGRLLADELARRLV
jgi:putative oxygen-independent coproporphyrinogen III oxidase